MGTPAMRMSEEDNRTDGEPNADPLAPARWRGHPAPAPSPWRVWIAPLLLTAGAVAAVHPFDAQITGAALRFAERLSGDVRRELFAWQQYGQGLAIGLIALAIWLQDPARRRRLLDLGLVVAIAAAVANVGKLFVGRPRPRPEFADPQTFLGPWGEYPILVDGRPRLVHAWDIAAGASTDLWSMPSSHTLYAAAVSVFVASVYPRLRWLVAGLTVVVGVGRVLFGAHWPTDVIVGAGAGYIIGGAIAWNYAGVRVLDWVWVRFVNRSAEPALPRVIAAEVDSNPSRPREN